MSGKMVQQAQFFECPFDGTRLKTKDNLARHIIMLHVLKVTLFQCPFDETRWESKEELMKHIIDKHL